MRIFRSAGLILLLLMGLGINNIDAQLELDFEMTDLEIGQNLVGLGVEVIPDSIQVLAADSSYAYFNYNGSELGGTANGLLLTTGNAENALGPNDETGLPELDGTECLTCDYYDNEFMGSPLISLANGGLVNWDACQFQFSFIPQGDSVTFDYSFASEEYIEWVGSSFNDAFGFFVTGPGIGTDVNVATLEDGVTTVSINTVNHIDNTEFFFLNDEVSSDIQYDGYTVNTRVKFPVESCEIYTIKLIVADGTDRMYDSAVFIEELTSNPVTIETSTAEGTDFMIEGCNDGTVTFVNPFVAEEDTEVVFQISGSADFGSDYTTSPDINDFYDGLSDTYVVTIPAGEQTFSFDVLTVVDGPEGSEFVTISLLEQYCDTLIFESQVDFEIKDELPLELDPDEAFICPNESVQLTAVDSTFGIASISWDPTEGLDDPNSLTPIASPDSTTTYTITSVLGACENSDSVTVNVTYLDITFDVTNVSCSEPASGAIDVSVGSGMPPYTFDWTGPGDFSSDQEDLENLPIGVYCVEVTDASGCSTAECIELVEVGNFDIVTDSISTFNCGNISCNGFSDGFIDISVSGGTGVLTSDWSNDADTEDISGLSAGIYTVTVTDEEGCSSEASFELTEPEALSIELINQTNLLCDGTTTGAIEVQATGGCPIYSFVWSHDTILDAPLATDLATGNYTVSVMDSNGCNSLDSIDVFIAPPIDPLTAVLDSVSEYAGGYNISCPGASDGSIFVTISGGLPGYSFEWTHLQTGNTYSDEDPSGLPCGDYELFITDANDCEFILEVEVTCVPDIEIEFTTVQNPCDDPLAELGEIHITGVSGGHGGPYTTSWISGPSCPCAGDDLTDLASGDYVYEVIDALGCAQQFTITIGQNDQFTVLETITDSPCFNTCEGSIVLEITPPDVDSITWFNDDGFTASTDSIGGLCAGDYNVTIVAGTCEQTFSYTVESAPEIEIDIIQQADPSCIGQNDGIIEIAVSGGTGTLSVNWLENEDCDFTGSTDLLLENLFACEYIVEVTDDNGCIATESITLEAVEVMDIFIQLSPEIGGFNVACNGDSDANIDVTVSGGTPDCVLFDPYCYFYDWSEGDDITIWGNDPNSNNVTVGAGTYVINVTDANGCLATTSVSITEPPAITDDPNISPAICGEDADGFIAPNISGGTGTYTVYEWISGDIGINPIDSDSLINLDSGTYELYVEDSNGCSETFSYTIEESSPIEISTDTFEDISCFGECDGILAVSATGGTGPLTFDWNGPNDPIGTVITGLCDGLYILTVTDSLGCTQTQNYQLTEPDELLVDLFVSTMLDSMLFSVPCNGDSVATLEANISGGNPDYSYSWTDCDDNFISNATELNDLGAGCYSLAITDANGCVATDTLEVTEPEEPLLVEADVLVYPNELNISCYNAMDGEIDITVTGGVPEYTYLWELNNDFFGLEEDVDNLDAGLYELLVIDNNGCDTLIEVFLVQPPEILANEMLSTFDGGVNIACNDSCNGQVTFNPTGGIGPLEIEWEGMLADTNVFDGLCAGSFEYTITDSTNCSITDTISLVEPDALELSAVVEEISCFGLDDGSIQTTVTGGSGIYEYLWTPNSDTTSSIFDLGPDTYCVDVTDSNGCETSGCWTLEEPEELTASGDVTDASCGNCDGAIDLTAMGGTGTLDFSWGSEDQTELCPGDYPVTITDENDCSVTLDFEVLGPPPLVVDAQITDLLCEGDNNGAIDLTVTGGEDPFVIIWYNLSELEVGTGESVDSLIGGIYTAEITWGSEDCFSEFEYVVNEPSAITVNGFSPEDEFGFNITTIGGNDGEIITDVTGGTPEYDYIWDGPTDIIDGEDNPDELIEGIYELTVIDQNGCQVDTSFVLTGPSELQLPTGLTPNSDGSNDFYVILGLHLYPDNTLTVFNRWGNVVYEKDNYDNTWNGQNNDGEDLPNGTYFVVFEAGDEERNSFVDLRR